MSQNYNFGDVATTSTTTSEATTTNVAGMKVKSGSRNNKDNAVKQAIDTVFSYFLN